ncbi:hypothetical protein NDU88_006303 [Pleurodeles waltl]|uniref:Uncharacterized protein n=1 Tax=Pleurodeles waltl TaxID=8319 RepID=A0AAV7SP53_PLEWA|nr:hypothetical protein NDU88_006303 [Pleurodeles waltl]
MLRLLLQAPGWCSASPASSSAAPSSARAQCPCPLPPGRPQLPAAIPSAQKPSAERVAAAREPERSLPVPARVGREDVRPLAAPGGRDCGRTEDAPLRLLPRNRQRAGALSAGRGRSRRGGGGGGTAPTRGLEEKPQHEVPGADSDRGLLHLFIYTEFSLHLDETIQVAG